MAAKPTQSREGVKGQLPLAESRGGASGGAWGNAPTVPPLSQLCQTCSILPPWSQAAQRPCAVTLRVRRRAPKLLSPQLAHCRARWMRPTSIGRSRFLSVLVFFVAGRFRLCGGEEGALRSPPPPLRSAHPCCLISIVAEGFRIHPCKSNAQILPHSKSRRAFAQRFFVIHKDSTLSPLIPHPCPRRLPVPSSPPPSRRRGGRSTS